MARTPSAKPEKPTKRASAETSDRTALFADMFAALGTAARLRIVRLLLSAHPAGMVVGDLIAELDIPASTLSHHLDKLKNEGLVRVRREGTYLWYAADEDALRDLLNFLCSECCTRTSAIRPETVRHLCEGCGEAGPPMQPSSCAAQPAIGT